MFYQIHYLRLTIGLILLPFSSFKYFCFTVLILYPFLGYVCVTYPPPLGLLMGGCIYFYKLSGKVQVKLVACVVQPDTLLTKFATALLVGKFVLVEDFVILVSTPFAQAAPNV